MPYKRGDVVLVSLSPVVGSEQADTRPGVVVSYEPFHRLKVVTVVALTSTIISSPGRVLIQPDNRNGLSVPSDALAYQVRTLSTHPKRILKTLGKVSKKDLIRIEEALKIVFHLQ